MKSWFQEPGAYVLVDGQFGSTGKGLLAGYMAQFMAGKVNKITTNAGPNSGHTAYYPGHAANGGPESVWIDGGRYEKIVTQQLPVASVFLDKMGYPVDTIINAGAIIDHDIMMDELSKWCNTDGSRVLIHPNAALISSAAKNVDKAVLNLIAGTGKGIGPALEQKISRRMGKRAVATHLFIPFLPAVYNSWDDLWDWSRDAVFVETAQGFSLGINSARFYPYVTSRECTVMQALADARIPAQMLKKVVCTFRTYPIRVGNTEGSSGEWYSDQKEISWEDVGVEPELTTVTKRVRRVATWSWTQYEECLRTNRPDALFLNFCNYFDNLHDEEAHVNQMLRVYNRVLDRDPDYFLLGYGPRNEDVKEFRR